MDIEHLRTFLEVANTGSFQLAAKKLGVTQSTISLRIKGIEEKLNQSLLVRKRNGSELTAGGHQFLSYTDTMVKNWDQAQQEIVLPQKYRSIINLGIQINHWESIAVPFLQKMEKTAPQTAVKIISDYSYPLMKLIRKGLLDLAIIYSPQQHPDLKIETFLKEKLILVSTTLRKVENHQVPGYVFVDWGNHFRVQHQTAFPNLNFSKLSVGVGSVALTHILKEGGSGYFLESSVKSILKKKILHKVKQAPVFELLVFLVYPSSPARKIKLETALQTIKKHISNL